MLYFITIIRNSQNSIGNYSGSYITLDCTTESSPLTSQSGWKPAEISLVARLSLTHRQTERQTDRQKRTHTHTHPDTHTHTRTQTHETHPHAHAHTCTYAHTHTHMHPSTLSLTRLGNGTLVAIRGKQMVTVMVLVLMLVLLHELARTHIRSKVILGVFRMAFQNQYHCDHFRHQHHH